MQNFQGISTVITSRFYFATIVGTMKPDSFAMVSDEMSIFWISVAACTRRQIPNDQNAHHSHFREIWKNVAYYYCRLRWLLQVTWNLARQYHRSFTSKVWRLRRHHFQIVRVRTNRCTVWKPPRENYQRSDSNDLLTQFKSVTPNKNEIHWHREKLCELIALLCRLRIPFFTIILLGRKMELVSFSALVAGTQCIFYRFPNSISITPLSSNSSLFRNISRVLNETLLGNRPRDSPSTS